MRWVVRVWSHPEDPDGFRVVCEPPVSDVTVMDRVDAAGQGSIKVPADYEHLSLIRHSDPTDPSAEVTSLVALHRVAADDTVSEVPDVEFWATQGNRTDGDDSSVTISGPTIRGGIDDAVVHPRTDTERDWIWGGATALPDLSLAALGSVRSEWHVALPGETYEVAATADDWTLAVGGNATGDLDEEASAGAVKSALEDLPGVAEVAVSLEEGVYTVEFVVPRQIPGSMTGTGATVSQIHAGYDTGGSPTFKLEVTANEVTLQTTAIPAGGTASQVEGNTQSGAGLQGLANINDVTVSGRGLLSDPWVIVAVNPPQIDTITVEDWAADDVVVEAVAGALSPEPVTISRYIDARAVEANVDHGTYGDPALLVDTVDVRAGSEWSLVVDADGQFAGSQIVARVRGGTTYQASAWIKPSVDGRYRLVIRDPFETLIKQTSPAEVFAPAGVWTRLTVPDVFVFPGVDTVIMRVAVVSDEPESWAPFRVDWSTAVLAEGMAATTIGRIDRVLIEAAKARGVLGWLSLGFTDTHDSNNVAWDEPELAWRADVGEWYGTHQLAAQRAAGYESEVVRRSTLGPSGETHELRLFNPGGLGGVSSSLIVPGVLDSSKVSSRRLGFTHLLVEDDQGGTVDVAGPSTAGLPRREAHVRAEFAPDEATAQRVADAAFADAVANTFATQVTLKGESVVPWRDFGLGWQLDYALGGAPRHTRRVHAITVRSADEGWAVEVSASDLWPGEAAAWEALRRLMSEFARRRRQRPSNLQPSQVGGAGGMATLLVMPEDHPQAAKADVLVPADPHQATALLNDALVAVSLMGGLGSGTVWVDDGISIAPTVYVKGGTELRGVGRRTTMMVVGGDPEDGFVEVETGATLRDIRFFAVGGPR